MVTRQTRRENDVTIEELEKGLPIDENALEEASRDQPELFYRVARMLADDTARRDAAKQELQETEADSELDIRQVAEKRDEKITEAKIKAEVRLDQKVQDARSALNKLSHRVDILSALKESYKQRGYALERLVDLYLGNYFGASAGQGRSSRTKEAAASHARREMSRERRERD